MVINKPLPFQGPKENEIYLWRCFYIVYKHLFYIVHNHQTVYCMTHMYKRCKLSFSLTLHPGGLRQEESTAAVGSAVTQTEPMTSMSHSECDCLQEEPSQGATLTETSE